MEAWQISFKIRYEYPFIQISGKYPGAKISMWCVWDREMVHVPSGSEELMQEVENYAKSHDRVVESHKPSRDGTVLTLRCTCDILNSMWNITERNHCQLVHPVSYLDGWGYFRVISFDESDTKKLFSDLTDLGPTELLSKRRIDIGEVPSSIWIESFFSRLTRKQIEAILKAFDYGYYTSPREITTDTIATSLGIARSTYEEHLRKAENRIMESMAPYLRLFEAGGRKRSGMMVPDRKAGRPAL